MMIGTSWNILEHLRYQGISWKYHRNIMGISMGIWILSLEYHMGQLDKMNGLLATIWDTTRCVLNRGHLPARSITIWQ